MDVSLRVICGRFVNILINHFWIPAGSKELLAITSASRFPCLVCYLFGASPADDKDV